MQSKVAADVKGKANTLPSFGGLRQPADSITANTRDQQTPEPATPCSASAESRDTSVTASTNTAPKKRINWTNIILWKEPLQSLFIFTVGLFAFGLLTFAAYGAHNMTVVSGEQSPSVSTLLCKQVCRYNCRGHQAGDKLLLTVQVIQQDQAAAKALSANNPLLLQNDIEIAKSMCTKRRNVHCLQRLSLQCRPGFSHWADS